MNIDLKGTQPWEDQAVTLEPTYITITGEEDGICLTKDNAVLLAHEILSYYKVTPKTA